MTIVNGYFHQKSPSSMFDWVLNTPLESFEIFRKIFRKEALVEFILLS